MKYFALLSVCIYLFSFSPVFSQEENKFPYLIPSDQILSMMENSQIAYEPRIVDDVKSQEQHNFPTLNDQLYLEITDSTANLLQYSLSESGNKTFNLAEQAYTNKEYDKAITLYKKVLETDPDYNKVFCMIGDQYFMKKDYDSAKYYFKLAIEKNFVDYSAHWFLADTYAETGETEEGLKHITIGHLLNRNHKNMYNILKSFRRKADKSWKEWDFAPQCTTYMENDKVVILSTEQWAGYACAEALWKFEPGFAESICGKKYEENRVMVEKEMGCIYANANFNSEISKEMVNAIEEGYFAEMVWYEIISKKAPSAMLLIPKDFFNRIAEYVHKFH